LEKSAWQAVPIINKTKFEKIPIPLPPLPKQRKIAAILSTWDIRLEPPSEEGEGAEFTLHRGPVVEYYQLKRQHARPGDWSIAELARKGVLRHAFAKTRDPNGHSLLRFDFQNRKLRRSRATGHEVDAIVEFPDGRWSCVRSEDPEASGTDPTP
jgi:hypothetical protein